MQNILFDSSLNINALTGIGYVSRVILYILIRSGKRITIYSDNDSQTDCINRIWEKAGNNSVQIKIIKDFIKPYTISSLFSFYKLDNDEIDSVFCPFAFPLELSKYDKKRKINYMYLIHDLCCFEKGYYNFFSSLIKNYFFKKRIINSLSYKYSEIYTMRYSTSIKIRKLFKIRNTKITILDFPYFFGDEWNEPQLENKNKIPYVLFICNSRNNKNLKLIKYIVSKLPNVLFKFIGDLKSLKIFKKFENIEFHLNITDKKVANMILNSNVYISTSTCEGLCLPVCRANALGIPTAAFKLDIYDSKEFKNLFFINDNNLEELLNWIKLNLKINNQIKYKKYLQVIKKDNALLEGLVEKFK